LVQFSINSNADKLRSNFQFAYSTDSTQAEGKKNSEKDASISNALVENFRGPI
jgi:hypothetical protein